MSGEATLDVPAGMHLPAEEGVSTGVQVARWPALPPELGRLRFAAAALDASLACLLAWTLCHAAGHV